MKRLEEWKRDYCLINAMVDRNGGMIILDKGSRVHVIDVLAKEARAFAIALLTDDLRSSKNKRSCIGIGLSS